MTAKRGGPSRHWSGCAHSKWRVRSPMATGRVSRFLNSERFSKLMNSGSVRRDLEVIGPRLLHLHARRCPTDRSVGPKKALSSPHRARRAGGERSVPQKVLLIDD